MVLLAIPDGRAEEVVLDLRPSLSSVDLTAFGYVDNPAFTTAVTSTRDSQTMPLGGTITLDVDFANDIVEAVDFVALEFHYLVDPENPTVHKRIPLLGSPEGVPTGAEVEVHLPFIEDLAAGNPVPRFAPTLTTDFFDKGEESGEGGELKLTDPLFRFVGSGQYFNLQTDPDETPFVDGWPMDYGPYPTSTPFPSMMPGTEFIAGDPPNTTMTPAPEGPNFLDGMVSVVNGAIVFEGSLLSFGVGGAGILQTAQIHEGTVFASNAPIQPGDFDADGDVDGADCILWQRMPEVGDLADWESNFGSGQPSEMPSAASSSRQAPEPATLALLGPVAALALFRRCYVIRFQRSAPLFFTSMKGPCS